MKGVTCFNSSAFQPESRVLASARKFGDLGVVVERELAEVEPVERMVWWVDASDMPKLPREGDRGDD